MPNLPDPSQQTPRDAVSLAVAKSATDASLERKVQTSANMLLAERVWLRLWWFFAVLGAFLLVSLAGLWPYLPNALHMLVLGGFGVALTGALVYVCLLYTSPSPRDGLLSRMPSSA